MNFYKRHIGDYLKKTAHLSLLEHGVYTRLLDVYYTREDGIPKVEAARLIGARTREEKAALESVLNEFFECFDGIWRQGRCDEEIAHANQKAERNREIGKKGGRPPRNGTQGNNGQEPRNNPDGFHLEPTDNPIQTPDSRLQTLSSREGRDKRARPKSPKSSTMPEGYDPEPMRQWTVQNCPGVDFDQEIRLLRDHEFKSPRSKWDAVVRTWMTRALKYAKPAVNGYGRHPVQEQPRRPQRFPTT